MGVLDGKAAIVTGSARGIGRATAELLSEQGARVLINDLDGDVAEQAAGEIKGESCGRIERGLELVSPLPAENVGGLAAFIFELADVKAPAVCPAAASATKR